MDHIMCQIYWQIFYSLCRQHDAMAGIAVHPFHKFLIRDELWNYSLN